jgi:HTH-type transcriptional regulator/antitoxin HipB
VGWASAWQIVPLGKNLRSGAGEEARIIPLGTILGAPGHRGRKLSHSGKMSPKPRHPSSIVPLGKILSASDVGKAVRAQRKANGVTLIEAAGLMNVGVRFLSELERGKPTASLEKTLRVLQHLGLELWVARRGTRVRV